jgi:PAS domain S-box-containing protein
MNHTNRQLQVLLVEDDATSKLILGRVLAQRYEEVHSFGAAEQAQTWCADNVPNLVVLDLQLPGMSGLGFSQWIRSQPWGEDVYILVVTGSSGAADLRQVLTAGANDYVSKPLDISAFRIRLTVAEEHIRQIFRRREVQLINRRIIDAAPDGFIVMNSGGEILDVNPAFTGLVGYVRGELIGKNISMIEDPDPQAGHLLQVIGNHPSAHLETRYRHKDARWIDVDISATQLKEADTRIFVFIRDVTQRKRQLEEHLRTSKLESIGLLAGGIAHELNNALTAIIGNISLAQSEVPNDRKLAGFFGKALDATQRAGRLARQLLTFAKGGEPARSVVNLRPTVLGVQSERIGLSSEHLEMVVGDNLWMTDVDEVQILQVVENLLLNAREASPPNASVVLVMKNVEIKPGSNLRLAPGRYVQISVTDVGPGISREAVAKVFDPYFSTKGSGRGLGLAICHSIIRRHGGTIQVESSSSGSRFDVFLPAVTSLEPPTPREPGSPPSPSLRVLVMDDEPTIRELLSLLLERAGFSPTTAADGEEALKLFAEAAKVDPFRLAILDLTVPNGLGGVETTRLLLQQDPNLPIIVCSGYSNNPVMANYRDYGFKGRLHKPFTNDQLLQALQDITAKS